MAHVCFIAASLPWTFGAYQAQQNMLARAFHLGGYSTSWMPRTHQSRLPAGFYSGWDEIAPLIPGVRAPSPLERQAASHIRFVGVPDLPSPVKGQPNILTMQQINQASLDHGIDAFIFLMDIGNMYLNQYTFNVPAILWLPYHHEEVDSQAGVLSHFTAVAALAPSTGKVVEQVQSLTRVIPHAIDRKQLNAYADEWEANAGQDLSRSEQRGLLYDSQKWDRSYRRAIEPVEDDTFVVLMQGGNYEEADRKGWVPSLRAFAQFHRDHPQVKKHLWLHAIDSVMVEQDMNHGKVAPVAVRRSGAGLRVILEELKIPEGMYTLDENLHDRPMTSALKRHADVCLHTSKAEGFGMVVLECQALGTPVITTNYTAMRDYTKYGVAVDPAELQSLSGAHFFAVPDTKRIAAALADVVSGKFKETAEPVEEVHRWIDSDFSVDRVFSDFEELLKLAMEKNRQWVPLSMGDTFESRPLFKVTTDAYPRVASWDNPWTLYHSPDVEVNYAFVQQWLVQHPATTIGMAIIPTNDARGNLLPASPEDGVHNVNPRYAVLLQTWTLRQMQMQSPYIWAIVWSMFETYTSQNQIAFFPTGFAVDKAPLGAKYDDPPFDPRDYDHDEL